MSQRIATRREVRHGKEAHGRRSAALIRYLWPFWLFRDASRGDMYARAAAYRHNREMRVHLPTYLWRWGVGSALTLGIARQLAALSSTNLFMPDLFLGMAAAIGMLFASELCLMLVVAYVYFYLSHHMY